MQSSQISAALLGFLFCLPFTPLRLVGLVFICLPALMLLINQSKSPLEAFWLGFLFMSCKFIGDLHWLIYPVILSKSYWLFPACIMLPFLLALYYGLATLIYYFIIIPEKKSGLKAILTFSSCIFLADWMRGSTAFIIAPFPWDITVHSLAPYPLLLRPVRLFGMYGANFILLLIASSPIIFRFKRIILLGIVINISALLSNLYVSDNDFTDFRVRIVQPNISQLDKKNTKKTEEIVEKHLKMSVGPPVDIVIWPESLPISINPQTRKFTFSIESARYLIAGVNRTDGKKIWNSLVMINRRGEVVAYSDKTHLAPVGEYTPFRRTLEYSFKLFTNKQYNKIDFSANLSQHPLIVSKLIPILGLICYDAAFPLKNSRAGASADVIINTTNDGWLGNTTAPYQHLNMAKFRALESGLPLIRAANTGISAIISPYGEVLSSLPLNTEGIMEGAIPGKIPLTYQFNTVIWPVLSLSLILILFTQRGYRHLRGVSRLDNLLRK